ncbi:site-specific integrase [Parafrankia sp. EUN1f]|uniref:tyrosine-type recombinase/integrase n=1 Tax=Parafrankia sp. EUN1f TaxID=102897 RepID=UPI0001C43F09|nr:site-specific integrase [Parafrankia sp. EUN1f]EFC83496.1 integrase family protein [Parafrankia sp. EUN1f]
MVVRDELERDVLAIRLPGWGRVVPNEGVVPWLVLGSDDSPVVPIKRFLHDFAARGYTAGSVRSYCYALLRWRRFLDVVGVEWDRATSAEVRDFVLWLAHASKRVRRTKSATTAGTINPVTRKAYLDDSYQPRTIRHSNAVLRTFYGFWIERGHAPLVNPVPLSRQTGRRPHAHHNPREPFRTEGRLRYNPKIPRRPPRAMPDERWNDLFGAMRSNRDRALLALAVSTAARASDLLGLRCTDLDWGDQLIRVRRKGTGAEQWLPASPEAFVWLRLYLADIGRLPTDAVLWWTLRRRCDDGVPARRPFTYDALRAVLRRVNEQLGSNWTMHDLRHTCAIRMVRDEALSLRDVQTILGHVHLTTTQIYVEDDDAEVFRRVRQHLADRDTSAPPPPAGRGYDAGDLAVLFGGAAR